MPLKSHGVKHSITGRFHTFPAFFFIHCRIGEMVLTELRQAAPRAGDSPQRFLGWLAQVHHLAPEAVGIAEGPDSDWFWVDLNIQFWIASRMLPEIWWALHRLASPLPREIDLQGFARMLPVPVATCCQKHLINNDKELENTHFIWLGWTGLIMNGCSMMQLIFDDFWFDFFWKNFNHFGEEACGSQCMPNSVACDGLIWHWMLMATVE